MSHDTKNNYIFMDIKPSDDSGAIHDNEIFVIKFPQN